MNYLPTRKSVVRTLLLLALFALLFFAYWAIYMWAPAFHVRFLQGEDGVVEWIGAAGFLAGAILAWRAAWRAYKADSRLSAIYLALLALFLSISFGEEISWGQRLFGFETPAWMAAINEQGELSLHNVDYERFHPVDVLSWFVKIFAIILPLVLIRWTHDERSAVRRYLAGPGVAVLGLFTELYAAADDYLEQWISATLDPIERVRLGIQIEEIQEMYWGLLAAVMTASIGRAWARRLAAPAENGADETPGLAFGLTRSNRRYKLRYARYMGLAEALSVFAAEQTRDAKLALLDVGAGRGRTLQYAEAAGVADRFEFHGIDIDAGRLAAIYGRERWRLTQGNIEEGLPYRVGQFDVVVCEQVLEHLQEPARALREIGRVLRPGGLMVLGVPIFPLASNILRRKMVPLLDRVFGIHRDHCQFFSLPSLRQLMRSIGQCEVVNVRGFRIMSGGLLIPLENFRWWWQYNLFLGRKLPWLCTEVQILARRTTTGESA